jgi:rubrerythrin
MDLATFGAIMSYALEIEERAFEFYTAAARGQLEEVFSDLARASKKRAKRMERTRREGVAEMILEPITGLNGEDYLVGLSSEADEPALLKQALALTESATRFYRDAAAKLPIREVVRTFTRMADESEKHRSRLAELE